MASRGPEKFWWFLAAACLLAGCHSATQSNVTGSHGGLLPGMAEPNSTLTSAQVALLHAPANLDKTKDEHLPDGRYHRVETMGGALYSETWFSPAGVPVRKVMYTDGSIPLILYDYGSDGHLTQATTLYPGTAQARRLEEYDAQGDVVKFTDYFPAGGVHIVSENNLPSPSGPVWRVQEWYPNGLKKSVTQHDPDGLYEGRQTTWDANGAVLTDEEYSRGVLQRNYLNP